MAALAAVVQVMVVAVATDREAMEAPQVAAGGAAAVVMAPACWVKAEEAAMVRAALDLAAAAAVRVMLMVVAAMAVATQAAMAAYLAVRDSLGSEAMATMEMAV